MLVIVTAPVAWLMLRPVPLTAALVTPLLVNVTDLAVLSVVMSKPVLPTYVNVSVGVIGTTVS